MIQSPWTEAMMARVRALWMQDNPRLSAEAIAQCVGMTKNAILGHVHRAGLPSRGSPIRRYDGVLSQPKAKPPRTRKHAVTLPPLQSEKRMQTQTPIAKPKQNLPPPKLVKPPAQTKAIVAKSPTLRECCWPEGDPGSPSFHFCGAPAATGRPYCEEHCKRAYIRVTGYRTSLDVA